MIVPIADVQSSITSESNESHMPSMFLAASPSLSSNLSDPPINFPSLHGAPFLLAVLLMASVVVASNLLVQFALNDWLTWGALSYPLAFLLADLLNRRWGPVATRRVALASFIVAMMISSWAATYRIAAASGTAFICAQLVDIEIFNRLRNREWWFAPFISGVFATVFDTTIFFFIAFVGTNGSWVTWALGDMMIKMTLNVLMLVPFRIGIWNVTQMSSSVREYT